MNHLGLISFFEDEIAFDAGFSVHKAPKPLGRETLGSDNTLLGMFKI